MSISYHDTVKFLQGMIENTPSPFARSEWFGLLAENSDAPVIAVAERGPNCAALVLERKHGRLQSLVNWYSFSWQASLSNDPVSLAMIAADLRTQTHRVTLWPVPDEYGSATTLQEAFEGAGWSVLREPCDHNHVLTVASRSFDDYWAQRSGKMRTTLKRKAKKVDVEILSQFDPAAWAEYETIYQASWKPEEGDPVLLRKFAEQEGGAGRIRLAIARYQGVAVAAQFWTVENAVAYIHKLAHLEEHKALSAGTTLTAALFRHVIDSDGVDLIDFGTGNDPYKRDWMEDDRPRYRLDCIDLRQPQSWPVMAKRIATKVIGRVTGRVAPDAPRS